MSNFTVIDAHKRDGLCIAPLKKWTGYYCNNKSKPGSDYCGIHKQPQVTHTECMSTGNRLVYNLTSSIEDTAIQSALRSVGKLLNHALGETDFTLESVQYGSIEGAQKRMRLQDRCRENLPSAGNLEFCIELFIWQAMHITDTLMSKPPYLMRPLIITALERRFMRKNGLTYEQDKAAGEKAYAARMQEEYREKRTALYATYVKKTHALEYNYRKYIR